MSGRLTATLIVEDQPLERKAMERLVKSLGHEVETAGSVAEAMEKLACCGRLLLDMNLPDGDGTMILRHIRTEGLPVKVAVISGTTDAHILDDLSTLYPDAIFFKPPDIGELTAWLSKVA